MIEIIRASVRPVVTIALVGGFIAAAFIDAEAAKLLMGLTGTAVGFWFADRSKKASP